jgi:sugar lactone lactonase YvrE
LTQKGNIYVAQWSGGKMLKICPDVKLMRVSRIAAGRGTTNVAFGNDGKYPHVSVVKDPEDSQAKCSILTIENIE